MKNLKVTTLENFGQYAFTLQQNQKTGTSIYRIVNRAANKSRLRHENITRKTLEKGTVAKVVVPGEKNRNYGKVYVSTTQSTGVDEFVTRLHNPDAVVNPDAPLTNKLHSYVEVMGIRKGITSSSEGTVVKRTPKRYVDLKEVSVDAGKNSVTNQYDMVISSSGYNLANLKLD